MLEEFEVAEECYTHTDHLQFSRKAYYSFFEKIVHYGLLISKRLARDCFVQKNKNESIADNGV